MAAPSKRELLNWAENYVSTWNAGDKDAWLLENHLGELDGGQVEFSIETYRFDDDGSVTVRTYYRVPTHQDKTLGDIFKRYQPEHEQGL